jgi:hypothetical protein
MHPICDVCSKELQDWIGNIMISSDDYFRQNPSKVESVNVFCKSCTRKMDGNGTGKQWHNLWELLWLKESTIYWLGSLIADLTSEEPRIVWSQEAVEKVYALAAKAHPNLSEGAAHL